MNEETKNDRPVKTADEAPVAVTAQKESSFLSELSKTVAVGFMAGAAVWLGSLAAYKAAIALGWINETTPDGAQA